MCMTSEQLLQLQQLAVSKHLTITFEKTNHEVAYYLVIDTGGFFTVEDAKTVLYDGPDVDKALEIFNQYIKS